jgi:hypothetical protein
MSASLQRTLTAEAYPAEGQFLIEGQTVNTGKSRIYRAGSRKPTVSRRGGLNLEP